MRLIVIVVVVVVVVVVVLVVVDDVAVRVIGGISTHKNRAFCRLEISRGKRTDEGTVGRKDVDCGEERLKGEAVEKGSNRRQNSD